MMTAPTPIPLSEQIAAVSAYIARCSATNAILRNAGVPASSRFNNEIAAMKAVLVTLREIETND